MIPITLTKIVDFFNGLNLEDVSYSASVKSLPFSYQGYTFKRKGYEINIKVKEISGSTEFRRTLEIIIEPHAGSLKWFAYGNYISTATFWNSLYFEKLSELFHLIKTGNLSFNPNER